MRAKVVKMNELTLNKLCSKLKIWSVEVPNAPYSKRYRQFEIKTQN